MTASTNKQVRRVPGTSCRARAARSTGVREPPQFADRSQPEIRVADGSRQAPGRRTCSDSHRQRRGARAPDADDAPSPQRPFGNSGTSGPSTGRVCSRARAIGVTRSPTGRSSARRVARIRPLVELDGEISSVARCHRASIRTYVRLMARGDGRNFLRAQRFTPSCDSMSRTARSQHRPEGRPSSTCSGRTVEAKFQCRSTLAQPVAGSTPTTGHRSATSSS